MSSSSHESSPNLETAPTSPFRQIEAALRQSEERFQLLAEHAQDLIYRYRLAPNPGFEYVSPSATAITGYTPEEHYADPELGFKLVHPADRHLLEAASTAQAGSALTLRWQRKDGSVIWTEQVNRLITDADGQVVAMEGIARDVTMRKEAEEQVRIALAAEQSARLTAEQSASRSARLQAIAAALAAALTRDAVVSVILEHAGANDARTVVLSLLDASGEHVDVIGAVGRDESRIRAYQGAPIGAIPPLEAAIRSGEPVWLPSVAEADAQFPGSGPLMEAMGDQSHATLPLVTAGRTIGAISLSFGQPTPFSAKDRAFLNTMAQQFAQALDRARLFDEVSASRQRLQQLSQRLLTAQEQERRHIARELHDEISQALGALKINLHMIGIQPTATRLHESIEIIDGLIQQVRALSLDLRPSVLDDLGLAAALAWYSERLQQRTGLSVTFTDTLGQMEIPPLVATTCFRIAQESLTNVIRHAHARQVVITLSWQKGHLVLSVCDDGLGFDVADRQAQALSGVSLGLISMAERAELIGGWVDISAAPGMGAEVWAWLPLHDAPPPEDPDEERA